MDLVLVLVIFATSLIQSIFGVGVLLFGTPLLLLYGIQFTESLAILLPISMTINLLQMYQGKKHIIKEFYVKLLIFTIPPIVISLALATTIDLSMAPYVGVFLIFISMKSFSKKVNDIVVAMFKYERTYFIAQGVIHGMTNLGGPLLTSKVFSMDISKPEKRAVISVAYFTFASFQLLTLYGMGRLASIDYRYPLIGGGIFLITDHVIFKKISQLNYDTVFAIFLCVSGLMLILKG